MQPDRFDDLARGIATGAPRRAIVVGLAAGLLGAALPAGWVTMAAAAVAARSAAICRGDRRCASLQINPDDGSLSPGPCPSNCVATANAVLAGLRADWRLLALTLSRQGYRLKNKFGDPKTLLQSTTTGLRLYETTSVTWVKQGVGEAELIFTKNLRRPANSVAYAIVGSSSGGGEVWLGLGGVITKVTAAELRALSSAASARATASMATPRAAISAQVAGPGSGFVSTALCTSGYAFWCDVVALFSCNIVFGAAFGLALKGFTTSIVAGVENLAAIAAAIDAFAVTVAARIPGSPAVVQTFARIIAEALKETYPRLVGIGNFADVCAEFNRSYACGTTPASAVFGLCCEANGGGTCGSSVCCRDSWACNPGAPIGFCTCPSGMIAGDGRCCQAGETACAAGCAPAGGCCPERRCPDGSCPDASGACGGPGGGCNPPCATGQTCLDSGSFNGVDLSAVCCTCPLSSGKCCVRPDGTLFTGGCCPADTTCCWTTDGAPGCCFFPGIQCAPAGISICTN